MLNFSEGVRDGKLRSEPPAGTWTQHLRGSAAAWGKISYQSLEGSRGASCHVCISTSFWGFYFLCFFFFFWPYSSAESFHFPNNLVVRLIQEIILIVISRITAEAICSAESQHSAHFLQIYFFFSLHILACCSLQNKHHPMRCSKGKAQLSLSSMDLGTIISKLGHHSPFCSKWESR